MALNSSPFITKILNNPRLNAAEEKWEKCFKVRHEIEEILASINLDELTNAAAQDSSIQSSARASIVQKLRNILFKLEDNAYM